MAFPRTCLNQSFSAACLAPARAILIFLILRAVRASDRACRESPGCRAPFDKQWYDARTDPSDFSAKSNYGSSRLPGANRTISVASSPATETRAATPSIKDAVGTQAVQLDGTGK